jgi:hypothetical protein
VLGRVPGVPGSADGWADLRAGLKRLQEDELASGQSGARGGFCRGLFAVWRGAEAQPASVVPSLLCRLGAVPECAAFSGAERAELGAVDGRDSGESGERIAAAGDASSEGLFCAMRAVERFFLVITLIVSAPLMLLWFCVPAIGGLFVGLPIAGVKFILTGRSGIEWYMDTVLEFVAMHWPVFLWMSSLERRRILRDDS